MPRNKRRKIIKIKWVGREEADAFVERRAQSVLGISGKRFVDNWKKGKYRKLDSDECPGVIELALIAALPRKKRAGKHPARSRR